MAYTDLTVANGWIPEQAGSEVLTEVLNTSAVERVGRRIRMTTDTYKTPRFPSVGADLVAEGAAIPLLNPTLDHVILDAFKWADRFAQSVEDSQDSVADFFAEAKKMWFSDWAVEFDNATLGVTANKNGTTVPFTSVYNAATTAGNRIQTAGEVTFEDVNDAFVALETSRWSAARDLVVIAHPSMLGAIRNLKDADGNRMVQYPLDNGAPTIFGHELIVSHGAATSTAPTHVPSGNPLLIVGSRRHLLVGVRSGPEYAVSDAPQWENDVLELKTRVRRAFEPATGEAFYVVEKTAGA
ncbi:major capsid protein [Satellite phage MiniFlayer]|nr:major capsid protein [Satellite phage MiniFlayer]